MLPQPSSPTVTSSKIIDLLCAVSSRNGQVSVDVDHGSGTAPPPALPVDPAVTFQYWAEGDLRLDFESWEPPAEPLRSYCKRMGCVCWPELWPLILIAIDKLCRVSDMTFNMLNCHRLVLTAASLMVKHYADFSGVSQVASRQGGVENTDLIDMEISFLQLLDWRLETSRSVYDCVLKGLPAIQAAAASTADGPLIPDEVMPPALWREHLGLEAPAVSPGEDSGAAGAANGPGLSPQLTWTGLSGPGCSTLLGELSPLVLQPIPEIGLTLEPADPPPRAPAIDEAFRVTDLPKGAVSVSSGIALGIKRRCSRASTRAASLSPTSSATPAPSPSSPPAADPRPPKQPRSTPARPHAADVAATGGVRVSTGSANCGKRARIEEARTFTQVPRNPDSVL
eukprot:TRINITY_DN3486_c0_g1_i1.p1 TRINITY_DN3486_c0_g1~~TRINITY_DN3486_c0_g1_i1.p1  ORF type:complete len:396 (+),score=74.71 TRINITY_DN3486_c0_g1_i1:127-1314(+)